MGEGNLGDSQSNEQQRLYLTRILVSLIQASFSTSMHHHHSSQSSRFRPTHRSFTLVSALSVVAIALLTFHAVSTLIFAVLGLAPSSPRWGFVPGLGGVLAIAGTAAIAQTFPMPKLGERLAGLASGGASGAILGFFYIGQLINQQAKWAIAGALFCSAVLGLLAAWSSGSEAPTRFQGVINVAMVLMANICAYGFAFGSGAWLFAAVSTGHWAIAVPLGLLTALYLWLTRRLFGQLTHLLKA